ncbi:betaine/proline/choline family ABC transporter ATP-binding protein [Flavonifractor plautii]|nr:ABC transporter ATP-binding protein [Flavonifractor plautii]
MNISLTIQDNEFFVLIGSSGCGKTTLLKTLNKLNPIDKGEILINGTPINRIKVTQLPRLMGYVVQEGGLFPHMTVEDNIALAMRVAGYPKEKIYDRITELLELVNLEPDQYRSQYPSQLSGGQRQRIGVARAFAADPEIILMDEPFSALDPMTRAELQDEVHRLQLRFHKTIVFVTHDMDEAVKLADRICILQNGHVVQCDKPENILKHPANEYINSFIGKNRLWENPSFIRAEDIMRPRPITISQSRTVVQAVQLMRHYNIDSLLVTGDDNKFAGMVWLQDLIGIDQYSSPISSFLSDDYLSVRVDDSLSTVLEKVADYGEKDFGILPVLDAEGAIRGFLNRSSLLSTLSRRFIDEPVERDEQEGA